MVENEEVKVDVPEEEIEEINEDDTTDWKAEAIKAQGIAKRYKTKFEKSKEAKPEAKPEDKTAHKKEDEDYAKLGYLEAKGVSEDDEVSFVEGLSKDSGKSLKELFGKKWFLEELKDFKATKASKKAIPAGNRRSGSSPKGDIEHWLEKPFAEVPMELRREVLSAKMKQRDSSKFYNQ